MQNENEVPAGSVVMNPIGQPEQQEQNVEIQEQQAAPQTEDKQQQQPDSASRLEEMLRASQSMIGRQSSEIGALRAKLEEMARPAPQPQGPSEAQVLYDLYKKMDNGEVDIADGMRQALEINSQLTASRVMQQIQHQQKQQHVDVARNSFLEKNPDYYDVLQSGALKSYLDADPLADEYTAFKQYKADERIKQLESEYQSKIAAAKEEGAKLAKGSEAAGKVLGRQGSSALPPQQPQRPFKNAQEAQAAMMETLKNLRSAGAS